MQHVPAQGARVFRLRVSRALARVPRRWGLPPAPQARAPPPHPAPGTTCRAKRGGVGGTAPHKGPPQATYPP
jgi:hypothetical protein